MLADSHRAREIGPKTGLHVKPVAAQLWPANLHQTLSADAV
jgi:hypothetical protein